MHNKCNNFLKSFRSRYKRHIYGFLKRRFKSRKKRLIIGSLLKKELSSDIPLYLLYTRDFNLINQDLFLNYGANTVRSRSKKINLNLESTNLLDIKVSSINGASLNRWLIGSKTLYPWNSYSLPTSRSCSRSYLYQHSYEILTFNKLYDKKLYCLNDNFMKSDSINIYIKNLLYLI